MTVLSVTMSDKVEECQREHENIACQCGHMCAMGWWPALPESYL